MNADLGTQNSESEEESGGVSALDRLRAAGEQIRAWQLAQKPEMTNTALCNRYSELGTTRTYKRVWSGEGIESLNAPEWANRYERALSRIQSDDLQLTSETIYDDLGPAAVVYDAWVRAMNQSGLQRLVWIEGDTGSGKTSALESLKARIGPANAYLVESHEGWQKLRTALQCLAGALNIKADKEDDHPQSAGDWIEIIIRAMNKRGKRTLLIDECHHWDGDMLNALKTMINRTSWVFVIAGMSTLLSKLRAAKSEEAKQLRLNRTLEVITTGAPLLSDATRYLERRLELTASPKMVSRLCQTAAGRGNFAFIRRVANRLARNAEGSECGDAEMTDAIVEALRDLGEGPEQ